MTTMPLMGHLPKGIRVKVQYDRVVRWHRRFEEHYSGKSHTKSIEEDCDDVLAFFIFCHQLKDWVIKDTTIPRREIEKFINENECLSICADIANGIKHLGIDETRTPRSGQDLRMHAGVYITGDKLSDVGLRMYITKDDGTQIEAFEIATECVGKWTEFLTRASKI
jgi:hypothetical protein